MGYYWEEFELGDRFETETVKITPQRVAQFAEVSGDDNPLHLRPDTARKSIYEKTIAHGMLIVSLFTGMNRKRGILKGTSLGVIHMEWDFRRPVYVGDRIFFRMVIADKRATSKRDRGLLKREVHVLREEDPSVMIQRGIFLNLVKRKTVQEGTENE